MRGESCPRLPSSSELRGADWPVCSVPTMGFASSHVTEFDRYEWFKWSPSPAHIEGTGSLLTPGGTSGAWEPGCVLPRPVCVWSVFCRSKTDNTKRERLSRCLSFPGPRRPGLPGAVLAATFVSSASSPCRAVDTPCPCLGTDASQRRGPAALACVPRQCREPGLSPSQRFCDCGGGRWPLTLTRTKHRCFREICAPGGACDCA